VEPVAIVEDARPVMRAGACPVDTLQEGARCRQSTQLDGRCVCWTSQRPGTVDGELTDASALPAASRTRLIVCKAKSGEPVVRWERDSGDVHRDCVVAARPVTDVTLGDAETDLVRELREACRPCVVTGSSWGRCPSCLLEPGGCAAACRE